MRSNISTAAFLLLCVLVFGFGMNACGTNASRDSFGYTRRDFNAKICGRVDGDEVEIIIKNRPTANEGEYDLTLYYTSPSALAGLVVSRTAQGEYEARLGELVMRNFKADGLFEPVLPFLYQGPATVRRNSDKSTSVNVSTRDYELEYIFQKECDYPQSIKGMAHGREIELWVQSLDFVS